MMGTLAKKWHRTDVPLPVSVFFKDNPPTQCTLLGREQGVVPY